jgi:osmoprotectant transport system permease protein
MGALAEGGMSDFGNAFKFIGDNLHLCVTKILEHLALSGAAIGVAVAIALPLGIWLGHIHRGSFLAVIAIGLAVLGIGFLNVMVALVILAVPPILTNAYVAVDGVDAEIVESARGMGMRPRQVLLNVELPLALPLIFAGIRTGAVYVIATATLAAIAGGGGLGDIIVNQANYGLPGVLAGAILVTALAFLAEGVLALVQRAVTPRGLQMTRDPQLVERPVGVQV